MPVRLDIAIVQVAPKAVIKITDVSFNPNQIIANGSQAILGTVCRATTRNPSVSSSSLYLANRNPSPVPSIMAMKNPASKR